MKSFFINLFIAMSVMAGATLFIGAAVFFIIATINADLLAFFVGTFLAIAACGFVSVSTDLGERF